MRSILLLAVLFTLCSNSSIASTENLILQDSIPVTTPDTSKSGPSGLLAFPFFLKSPETNWGFGAALVYFFKTNPSERNLRTSDVNLISLYTLKKQLVIVLGSTVYFPGDKKVFRWQGSYSYYPDKFWGIGNHTLAELEESYSIKQFFFNPQLLFKVHNKTSIGATVEYQKVSDFTYTPNGVFDAQNVSGKNGGATAGIGVLITYDTRNSSYYPTKGSFVELNATKFNRAFSGDFNFSSFTLELKKFYGIGKNTVLAFQEYGKFNTGDVPIRNLGLLGGSETMRGFYKGRYADKNMFSIQTEIRQFLFWRIGAAAFAGMGQVAPELSRFSLSGFHYAFGAGLRIKVQQKENLNLRVDLGVAEGKTGVYVILKEAF